MVRCYSLAAGTYGKVRGGIILKDTTIRLGMYRVIVLRTYYSHTPVS